MEDRFSHGRPKTRHGRPDMIPSGFSISIAPSRPVPAAESRASSIRSHSCEMCSHQGRLELRLEDPYVGAVLIGAQRPTEAARSSMQAAHTPPMTVPTQDDVGWTWLSHHGTAPAPPRGTPTPVNQVQPTSSGVGTVMGSVWAACMLLLRPDRSVGVGSPMNIAPTYGSSDRSPGLPWCEHI